MTQKPLILAVETSSRIGSVALAQGSVLLAETTFTAPLRHSAEIFPAIGRLLDRFGHAADNLTQIHVAVGPGSFTGLRIAVTAAKAMHLANAVQIVTADSLDVIAANLTDALPPPPIQNSSDAPPLDRIATVLDAKRGQFYVAVYERIKDRPPLRATGGSADYEIPAPDDCLWQKIVPDCLITARELIDGFAGDKPIGLLGDGLLYHRDKFSSDGVRILDEAYWSPRASKVHALGYQKAQAGLFADPVTLTPFYLRGPQVTLKKKS